MPFREPTLPLHDILDAIEIIEEFAKGMGFDQFRTDPKTVAAVERKLLVIGEAAVRLGREAPLIVPEAPWRNIRGMGNWLRHHYDSVNLQMVWNTVTDNLSVLKAAVVRALDRSESNPTSPPTN